MKRSKQKVVLPRSQKQLKRLLAMHYMQAVADTEKQQREQLYLQYGKHMA